MEKKVRTPQDQSRLNAHRTSGQKFHDGETNKGVANSGTQFVRDKQGNAWAYNPKFDKTFRVLADGTQVSPRKGNHLPGQNSVDGFIDDVLEKSGMTTPSNVPTPTPRPQQMDPNAASGKDDSMDLGETLDDVPPEEVDKALQEGWTTAEIAAAVAAGGVAAWMAKRAMTKPNGPEAAAMAGITPDSTAAQAAAAKSVADTMMDENGEPIKEAPKQIEGPEKQLQITDQSQPAQITDQSQSTARPTNNPTYDQPQAQLAAPEEQLRLSGPPETRTIDQRAQEMIEQTSGSEQDSELDRIMGEDDASGRSSTQARMQPANEDMLNRMAAMPQEQWTQFAAENGIPLDAQTLQSLAQRQKMIQQMIEKTAGRTAGQAARRGF